MWNNKSQFVPVPLAYSESDKQWWVHRLGSDDEEVDYTALVVQVISYIFILLVVLSFLGFLLCLCCPICILAKKRHRIRGHVYSRPLPGPIQIPSTSQGPVNIIAIRNNPLQSRNPTSNAHLYPVQESVTIIPVLPPVGAVNHPINPTPVMNYPMIQPQPQFNEHNDPPPPYPGPPSDEVQLPYNPYYVEADPKSTNQTTNES